LFARSGSGLVVDCGGTECDLTLPSLGEDQEYVLESFSYEVTAEAEAARFLEQVSIMMCMICMGLFSLAMKEVMCCHIITAE